MLWRLARRYAGRSFPDPFEDPLPAPQAPPQPNTGTATATVTHKLKTSVYTEQGYDTEVLPAKLDEVMKNNMGEELLNKWLDIQADDMIKKLIKNDSQKSNDSIEL